MDKITDKIKVCVIGENKRFIYLKLFSSRDNEPVGPTQEVPLDTWEDTEKEFKAGNIWEITIDAKMEKEMNDLDTRIKWLSQPARIVSLLRAGSATHLPTVDDMFALRCISTDYTKTFNRNVIDMAEDVKVLRDILNGSCNA
jgi:hypothetical protein